ncbi:hypothetical protein M5F66_01840 [Acinetobacter sp. ANC 5033]|uniref:hypothetical protein n=1 Tax=Acinetobacter amyesii TaxID=2942470 RepID=UPI00201B6781|nr:hypothetical protein [Acinetobacter amyesii]MCL6237096.1 hypothetical protein [Acinetobacter amyesii]
MLYFITILAILLLLLIIFRRKIDNYLLKSEFYEGLQKLLRSNLIKGISIILAASNAYILLCLGNDDRAKEFKSIFGKLGVFILDNGGIFVFISIIVAGIFPWLNSFVSERCNDLESKFKQLTVQYDISLKVLEQLEKVVVQKRQRFAQASSEFRSTPQTPKHKTVFERITQPDNQIQILIESLHDCIKSIYPNEYIKVALVSVKNHCLHDWVCHSPYDTKPRTKIDQLKDPKSTFSRVIALRKMIIVPDTKTEIQKQSTDDIMYIKGNTDPTESWCQVCIPIHSINNNETIFIISIAIKRANVVTLENEKFLEWLFKFFISRLALEHSLKELKEHISK